MMLQGRIRQTEGKIGSKHLLPLNGHGVPLSLIVGGVNPYDVSQPTAIPC